MSLELWKEFCENSSQDSAGHWRQHHRWVHSCWLHQIRSTRIKGGLAAELVMATTGDGAVLDVVPFVNVAGGIFRMMWGGGYDVLIHMDERKWETSNFDFDKFERAKISKTFIRNGVAKLKFKVFLVMSSKMFASLIGHSRQSFKVP